MLIEHKIVDTDTIQSIAYQYLGDAKRWIEIAEYNSLEYPYILDTKEAYEQLYANGYLTITRSLFTSSVVVYKGSQFSTKINSSGIRKVYEVTEDTILPAGEPVGYVHVRCINYGTFGNTIAGTIREARRLNTSVGSNVGDFTVTNEQPFNNGTNATVKFTGQVIYIPASEGEEDAQIMSNLDTYLTLLGGEDLALTIDGDLTDDGFGDLATKVGLNNIKEAVKHRFMTERGSIGHHPQYGSNLAELIGRPHTPYLDKLIELDIYETLSYEDRISSVRIIHSEVRGTSIYIKLALTVQTVTETVELQLDF